MTAVDEVRAAIDRLEQIIDEPVVIVRILAVAAPEGTDIDAWMRRAQTKAALFEETAHAQLAILDDWLERYANFPPADIEGYVPRSPTSRNAIALARAINAASSEGEQQ
jgi:hypothetical protein